MEGIIQNNFQMLLLLVVGIMQVGELLVNMKMGIIPELFIKHIYFKIQEPLQLIRLVRVLVTPLIFLL